MNPQHFLLQALDFAKTQRGFCSPNPSVGAVIVNEAGEVLATGYHLGAGHAHAEVDALRKLKGKAEEATIYITLEPCCHWGRTPPCTDAIIQSGIKNVVYGLMDPNPIVSGKSKQILAAENIVCEYVNVPEITEFYASYTYWHQTKKPFITAKIALSLDGKIAQENGQPIAITGPELKEYTYECRKHSDAILTTAKTILCDDPQMNVRGAEIIAKPIYILDRTLKISFDAKIFSTAKSVTIFHAKNIDSKKLEKFLQKNIRCIAIDDELGKLDKLDKLDLNSIVEQIGKDGVHDLWIEAGGTCFSEFAEQKLLQKMLIYVAPCWLGSGLSAFDKTFSFDVSNALVSWRQIGRDAVCQISHTYYS